MSGELFFPRPTGETRYGRLLADLDRLRDEYPESLRLCPVHYQADGSPREGAGGCACRGCVTARICGPRELELYLSGRMREIFQTVST